MVVVVGGGGGVVVGGGGGGALVGLGGTAERNMKILISIFD